MMKSRKKFYNKNNKLINEYYIFYINLIKIKFYLFLIEN